MSGFSITRTVGYRRCTRYAFAAFVIGAFNLVFGPTDGLWAILHAVCGYGPLLLSAMLIARAYIDPPLTAEDCAARNAHYGIAWARIDDPKTAISGEWAETRDLNLQISEHSDEYRFAIFGGPAEPGARRPYLLATGFFDQAGIARREAEYFAANIQDMIDDGDRDNLDRLRADAHARLRESGREIP